jgi:hypothetical protein
MHAGACLFGALVSCSTPAQPETGRVSRKDASDLVAQLVDAVETHALPPNDPAVQAQAKETLLRTLSTGGADDLDRAALYAAARLYLLTIDSDGHTYLWSKQYSRSFIASTQPADAERADVARIVRAGDSDVLVVRPPQTTFYDAGMAHQYATRLTTGIEAALAHARACAVVVDLGDQRGGNAWPSLAVLGALLTPANRARVEDRWGQRLDVVAPEVYASYREAIGPLPADPLAAFAGTGIAVVMAPETASAGEMVAVALAGEPDARSFGRPSYGKATSNATLFLPDGAMLVLSVGRYAMDRDPVLRGPLQPDFPADSTEKPEQSVRRAAAWAAANSTRCRRL